MAINGRSGFFLLSQFAEELHRRALKEFESFKTKGKDFLRSSKSICFSFQSSFLSEIFNRTLFCLRICGFRVSKISVVAISSDD